jgi:hypothetical protein
MPVRCCVCVSRDDGLTRDRRRRQSSNPPSSPRLSIFEPVRTINLSHQSEIRRCYLLCDAPIEARELQNRILVKTKTKKIVEIESRNQEGIRIDNVGRRRKHESGTKMVQNGSQLDDKKLCGESV